MPDRIYLDNAATSWPKPEEVYRATDDYQRRLGAPAGRGVYRDAVEVERLVADARRGVAELLGAESPERIVFTQNGTDSLNLALLGLLRQGDQVIASVAEHNSVLRPLEFLLRTRGVEVEYVPCDDEGCVDPESIHMALRSNTRLIVLTHISNVTGAKQPIGEIGRLARSHGVYFLVDAAQSLGHEPFDLRKQAADLVAAPGHKGLLGPLGTGVLYIRPGVERELVPLRFGGTGTQSESDRQPESLPDKYESGNLNVPGIVGLGAGVRWLREWGVEAIAEQLHEMTCRLTEGIDQIAGLRRHGPRDRDRQGPVVSFTAAGYDPQEFAALLDATFGIQCRAGLHCAPRMHESLGTLQAGGTVRLSPGPFTTEAEIDAVLAALGELAGE